MRDEISVDQPLILAERYDFSVQLRVINNLYWILGSLNQVVALLSLPHSFYSCLSQFLN